MKTQDAVQPKDTKRRYLEAPIAGFLILLFLPVFLLNSVIALVSRKPIVTATRRLDALGRHRVLRRFSSGIATGSIALVDIFQGRLAFVGVSLNHALPRMQQLLITDMFDTTPGYISLYDVHQAIGIQQATPWQLLHQQLNGGLSSYVVLLCKGAFIHSFYQSQELSQPKIANLFELPINNVAMDRAVDWAVQGQSLVTRTRCNKGPQLGFYINAHSVNLAESDPLFKSCLRQANALFADGSGMRVAAKARGIKLQSNINGTDMLPLICQRAEAEGKSIFLLGGQEGRAAQAAKKLQQRFPKLQIAGTQHGFFNFDDDEVNEQLVADINKSHADIVLVGLGSPNQEHWCLRNLDKLNCTSVLAVGGLFDYFSGAIPRAPLMFRELGLEWIWRLRQEPIVKFKRYVIGTPQFLIRTFLLKQV